MTADYAFVSRWTVARSRESLWDVLELLLETDDPMVWWPAVQVRSYDGQTMTVRAASAFGYALTFSMTDLDARRPDRLTFAASGDLRGAGVVTFSDSQTDSCVMDIDWQVTTDRGWMRRTSWLLRPLFTVGHLLIMRQGQRHLNAWLAKAEPMR